MTLPASGDKTWCVNGTWSIPKVSLPAGAKSGIWYTASTWIGIDGDDGSRDIMQAGCDAEVMISGGHPLSVQSLVGVVAGGFLLDHEYPSIGRRQVHLFIQ